MRVRDRVIVEVGANLAPDGEPEIDAGGAIVAPGFIDCHTHYDPSVWWDPLRRPDAATRRHHRRHRELLALAHAGACRGPTRASDVFGFIEDIPVDAFATGIPWTWESYAEWSDALRMHGTAVNIAALVGHSNLRVYVMGDDAWERAATPDETGASRVPCSPSRLAAGALGLSTSFVDTDRHAHPVPSRAADADEFVALIDVLGRAPGGARVLEFLPVDQGHRPSARRHRTRRALVRSPAAWRARGTSSRRTAATRRAPSA